MRISPDPDRFLELAAEHTVVPVWTEVLADLETPVSAFLKLVGDDHGFVFERCTTLSVAPDWTDGRSSHVHCPCGHGLRQSICLS